VTQHAEQTAATKILPWADPAASRLAGFARRRTVVPRELAGPLHERSSGPGLPAVLLGAHAKVLSALSSEAEVVTGFRTSDASGASRIALTGVSWRELAAAAADAITRPSPVPEDLETELDLRGLTHPVPAADPDPRLALSVAWEQAGDDLILWLVYRQDRLNSDAVDRIAGYYLTALRWLTGTPDTPHDQQTLLSEAERSYQADALAGPRRPLSGPLFAELFEQRVAQDPARLACAHGGTRWSYAELNERANRIANRLLGSGLRDEDVVAVVMERNPFWLAAVLGVLKAGGVYLPVRPDFPADRVATQLTRGECAFAVTEPGSETVLHAALARAGRTATVLPAALAEGTADNPRRAIRGDQAAYVYFTSGSTGAPKGAMCEHAGMLNHLAMKAEDMNIGAGDVVTQTASQCFDISLWQLLAPLLAGGSTEIIDTSTQLDVTGFIDRLAAGGIHVIQVVPAYLDALLSQLERHPRQLGDLRSISVTGEALRLSLVQRWFSLCPRITLVNAYGATEVSDDTMHAILTGPPERDFVPVGTSRRNVFTYVLDEQLRMVPLGAPGEIAFSGVCVGRGYINDPERTAQAFTSDPHRPGSRLYRTGDYGRWLPEGTIEFLGRRDEQVKIRGYRIEIGEIENRLLRLTGVDEAAVVISGESDQTRHLVAFVTGRDAPPASDQRDFLAGAVPDYMVPAHFHRLDTLPRTENGKVNKKRLIALARELSEETAADVPPATATERRLAAAWSAVLNVPVDRVGAGDDFFKLGGTSLAAVRLIISLDRAVSLRQLLANPVLSSLAQVMDGQDSRNRAGKGGVLQRLSSRERPAASTLICFPYAGGNAVNFTALARALAGADVDVYAAELPGHDIARPGEPLADVTEVASAALGELPTAGPVMLWGHCSGAAYALELAQLMTEQGRPPDRIMLGAIMLDEPARLRRAIDEVSGLSDGEITGRLRADAAYAALDLMAAERGELVARAYRHDVCSTDRYFLRLRERGTATRLPVPVDVIVADDDPSTAGYQARYRDWECAAGPVTVRVLAGGGHYFVRSHAAETAALIAALEPGGAGLAAASSA
jgi:amino acid adenylation domain-containing protein